MAIAMTTQKAMRDVRALPLCYLCTQPFTPTDTIDDDHVPPTGLFANADRNFPLILPTHKKCNRERSADDQVVSQLVGLLHGRLHNRRHSKLKLFAGQTDAGLPLAAVAGLDLRWIVRRWVRGFHAALY